MLAQECGRRLADEKPEQNTTIKSNQ